MNYGFEPEGASGGRGTITTELVLADTLMTERDAFITDIVTSFQSTADVREHLWHAFSTESFHQFGTAQSIYQWRYLAVLLAADGRTSELAQVEARMPNLWAAGVPASVQQDWDSVWQQAGLSRDS